MARKIYANTLLMLVEFNIDPIFNVDNIQTMLRGIRAISYDYGFAHRSCSYMLL